jgi:hypothetical protein
MSISILRTTYTDHSTRGILIHDDTVFCLTLEDVVRESGVKVPGATAIPEGYYEVVISKSMRFGCELPELLNVPGFDAIRIHGGNTEQDTDGCILVAFKGASADRIYDSAANPVTELIKTMIGINGRAFVDIHNGYPGYGIKI